MPEPSRPSLPLLGQAPAERADATRNRQILLETTAALVGELGAAAVTMDVVAQRAGVGKGTVFRRFGSRAGLFRALVDHAEREFQGAYMFGPPPLGPGAPPVDRIIAYGRAALQLIEIDGEVLSAAALATIDRYTVGAYGLGVTHVMILLRQTRLDSDPRLTADTILAPLDITLVLHQTRVLGYTLEQIATNWETHVRRILS